MTVTVQTPFNEHTANGVTTVFGYTFKLLLSTDLEVKIDGVVQSSGYTVSGLGVNSGGSVTFSTAPANLSVIQLTRKIPLSRSTDYQVNGDLPSDEVDDDYDRLWLALQDAAYFASRSLSVPAGDTATSAEIPSVATRASKYLMFAADGSPTVSSGLASVPVSVAMEAIVTAATIAAARAGLSVLSKGEIQSQSGKYLLTGGTSTAFTITTDGSLAALTDGEEYDIKFHTAAGTTPTLNRDGLGAKNLKYRDSTGAKQAVTSAQCPSGWRSPVFYDGTDYVLRDIPTGSVLSNGTKTATTSGYQIDWTGIPSTAKEVTISLAGVSTDGTSAWRIQIGDGAIDATSYTGAGLRLTNATAAAVTNFTDGFGINTDGSAAVVHGSITLRHIGDNVWVASGSLARSDSATVFIVGGSKTLAGTLDRIRLTNPTTDGFDLGSANISYQ